MRKVIHVSYVRFRYWAIISGPSSDEMAMVKKVYHMRKFILIDRYFIFF